MAAGAGRAQRRTGGSGQPRGSPGAEEADGEDAEEAEEAEERG